MGNNAGQPHIDALRALRAVYRRTGGLARRDDLARLLEDQQPGDFVSLDRLIASGDVFGFEWQALFWVPIFQFELNDLSLKCSARSAAAELSGIFDGWRLAVWFAQPNSWLDGRIPVDLLNSDLTVVREAARTDRFVAKG